MANFTKCSARTVATVMLVGLATPPLGASDKTPATAAPAVFHVMIANPVIRHRVALALHGAADRLAGSECQKVFREFQDGAGQPLQSKLDAVRQTGAEFLTWLRFTEGDGQPLCAPGAHVAAFTQPGSHVVLVCAAVFGRHSGGDPQAREVLMIHELLHTLGLEENPPSSAEISRGVLARCGSQKVQRKPI